MIVIDPTSVGNILLTIVTGLSAYLAARMRLAHIREVARNREREAQLEREKIQAISKAEAEKAELERQKIEAEAKAVTEKAKAEESKAEAQRIRNESEGQLLKITAEANQITQLTQLSANQFGMMEKAFTQMRDDNASDRAVQDKVAAALTTQSEAIKFMAGVVHQNHLDLRTDLEGYIMPLRQAVEAIPSVVDGKVLPLYSLLKQIDEQLVRMGTLVQGARLQLLVENTTTIDPSPIPKDDPKS